MVLFVDHGDRDERRKFYREPNMFLVPTLILHAPYVTSYLLHTGILRNQS